MLEKSSSYVPFAIKSCTLQCWFSVNILLWHFMCQCRCCYLLAVKTKFKQEEKCETVCVMVNPGTEWEHWENEFTHNLSGNTWPQSSLLAEPLWTDSGLKKTQKPRNCCVRADLHLLKKKCRWGMNYQTFPQNPCKQDRKAPMANPEKKR